MKKNLLKIGVLIFLYSIIIFIHLENNTYYLIYGVKPGEIYKGGGKLGVITAKDLNIPVNKYLSKDEYLLVKDLHLVANNTRIISLPFKPSRSLFLTIILLAATLIIIFSLNFTNNIFKKLV